MHARSFSREGELLVLLDDPFAANAWALCLDRAPLERRVPPWDRDTVAGLRQLLGAFKQGG